MYVAFCSLFRNLSDRTVGGSRWGTRLLCSCAELRFREHRVTVAGILPSAAHRLPPAVLLLRALVEAIHRSWQPILQNRFYCICCAVDQVAHSFELRLLELAQHELRAVAYRMIGLNSQSDPDELISSQRANQRLDSVVPRRSAALFNAQRAEGQVKLVVNNDQSICRLDLELIDQLAHRQTA